MKKYILILGIALLFSSTAGFLKPKERYYRSKSSGAVEISKMDFDSYKYSKFKSSDVNLSLVVLVFLTVLGGGLIISSFSFKKDKVKSPIISELSSLITNPISKTNKQNFEHIVKPDQIIESIPPPINMVLTNPEVNEKTNLSVFEKTDVFAVTKIHEKHDWHLTILIVLGTSLAYAIVMSITSSIESVSSTRFISDFFVMALGSIIIGELLASFAYLFTKKFETEVHQIIRVTAIVLTILSASGSIMHYFETIEYSNIVKPVVLVKESDQTPDQIYSNAYYSINYPKGSKISDGKVPGYIHQIIIESSSKQPNDYYQLSIGIHKNKFGQGFDKQVFAQICLENTKKAVAGYNVIGSWSAITNQQIGIYEASKFRLTYPWNGMTAVENDFVINTNKLVAVIGFSSFNDDKLNLQNQIISSLILN